jgi:hypothetical protein
MKVMATTYIAEEAAERIHVRLVSSLKSSPRVRPHYRAYPTMKPAG